MEWESDSPCHSHTYPVQESWSPGRDSSWELELRDCAAIPGWGVVLTMERWIEQMWVRSSWWEMLVEKSQAAMEARRYCWVTRRGWNYHHSLSLPTCQHQLLNNREAAPSYAWGTKLQSRTLLSSVQFSHSVVYDSLPPHGLQYARPPCPLLTPGAY